MPLASRVVAEVVSSRRWTALAIAWTLAIVLIAALVGPRLDTDALFALVPLFLSTEWAWPMVGLLSAPLVLLAGTDFFELGKNLALSSLSLQAAGVALGALVGMYAAIYRERSMTTLLQTRRVAEAAQRAILPSVPEMMGPYRFSALYRSAARESLVGGDFYMVLGTPSHIRLIVGDVAGHGLEAVSLSAEVLGCFREWAAEYEQLPDLVARLDERVARSSYHSRFVTAVVADLRADLRLDVANCGHPAPLSLAPAEGLSVPLSAERVATPLGLHPRPVVSYHQLHPADRVLFYTDGLIESRARDGRIISLVDVLSTAGSDEFTSALPLVWGRLSSWAKEVRDDVAMLMVECRAPA